MTPSINYANYLVAQSKRNEERNKQKKKDELHSLQKELLQEQIKEARLRNELLEASLGRNKFPVM